MAVTKILARRGGLAQAIAYVVNGDKTEEQVLTAAQGCSLGSACAEMQDAKIRWNKTDGVQLYHIIQSFRPGEITPGLALEIAQEFVREHLPGYQAVIGIHTDRDHIHAHIVFNSVNQLTGEKYHSNARSYYQQIRGISDRLCREHGLSVIMTGEPSKAVSYIEWLRQSKGQPTFRSMLEADLRTATQDANDLGHFFLLMEHMGYEIRHGDRLGFRLRGQERFMYPGRRDPLFTEDGIRAAIQGNLAEIEAGHRPAVIQRPKYRPYRKHPKYTGFLALYVHYLRCTCGGKMTRLGGGWQNSGKLYLRCEGCGNTAVMDMDATVNGIVRQFRDHEQPSCTAYTPSAEVMRLDNAINRGLEQPDSPEAVMALILQGAAARYACCPEPSAESEPSDSLTEADWRRFQRAVSHITISQDTEVTLIFTDKKATGKDE